MPAGPSPDQPRSEGSRVLKKGAWEEDVEGCTHVGEEPPDSQCCGHVAAKEGSGVRGEGGQDPRCCSSVAGTCSQG